MRQVALRFASVCSVVLLSMVVFVPAAFAHSAGLPGGQSDTPTRDICIGDTIPQGMVVIARRVDLAQCQAGAGNTWMTTSFNVETIMAAPKVEQSAWVCKSSPIPDGYVVLANASVSLSCQDLALQITLATGNSVTICADSPYPPSYVITGFTADLMCTMNLLNPFANNAVIIQPKPIQSPIAATAADRSIPLV